MPECVSNAPKISATFAVVAPRSAKSIEKTNSWPSISTWSLPIFIADMAISKYGITHTSPPPPPPLPLPLPLPPPIFPILLGVEPLSPGAVPLPTAGLPPVGKSVSSSGSVPAATSSKSVAPSPSVSVSSKEMFPAMVPITASGLFIA